MPLEGEHLTRWGPPGRSVTGMCSCPSSCFPGQVQAQRGPAGSPLGQPGASWGRARLQAAENLAPEARTGGAASHSPSPDGAWPAWFQVHGGERIQEGHQPGAPLMRRAAAVRSSTPSSVARTLPGCRSQLWGGGGWEMSIWRARCCLNRTGFHWPEGGWAWVRHGGWPRLQVGAAQGARECLVSCGPGGGPVAMVAQDGCIFGKEGDSDSEKLSSWPKATPRRAGTWVCGSDSCVPPSTPSSPQLQHTCSRHACAHMRTQTCAHTHMYVHTSAHMHTYMHMYANTNTCRHMHCTCMHTPTYSHVCIHVHACTHMHAHTYTCTPIQKHIRTYTRMHARTHIHEYAPLMRAKLLLAPHLLPGGSPCSGALTSPPPAHLGNQGGPPILVISACFIHSTCQRVIP